MYKERNCKLCKRPHLANHVSSPTKAYFDFEEYLGEISLNDVQLRDTKENAIAILRKAYDEGKDLDNDWGGEDNFIAEALDDYAMISLIEQARGRKI